jgi:hypothetical protein
MGRKLAVNFEAIRADTHWSSRSGDAEISATAASAIAARGAGASNSRDRFLAVPPHSNHERMLNFAR